MEPSTLIKRKRSHISNSDRTTELYEIYLVAQKDYRHLLQTVQTHYKYIQESRSIMMNIKSAVPRWSANIKIIVNSFDSTEKLIIPPENKDFYNVVDMTIDALEKKIEAIEKVNCKLKDTIESYILCSKKVFTIIKNLMYAHFSIKMSKKASAIPFPKC